LNYRKNLLVLRRIEKKRLPMKYMNIMFLSTNGVPGAELSPLPEAG